MGLSGAPPASGMMATKLLETRKKVGWIWLGGFGVLVVVSRACSSYMGVVRSPKINLILVASSYVGLLVHKQQAIVRQKRRPCGRREASKSGLVNEHNTAQPLDAPL